MAAHAASGTLRIPLLVWLFSPSPSMACLFTEQRHQHVHTLSVPPCSFTISDMELMMFFFHMQSMWVRVRMT